MSPRCPLPPSEGAPLSGSAGGPPAGDAPEWDALGEGAATGCGLAGRRAGLVSPILGFRGASADLSFRSEPNSALSSSGPEAGDTSWPTGLVGPAAFPMRDSPRSLVEPAWGCTPSAGPPPGPVSGGGAGPMLDSDMERIPSTYRSWHTLRARESRGAQKGVAFQGEWFGAIAVTFNPLVRSASPNQFEIAPKGGRHFGRPETPWLDTHFCSKARRGTAAVRRVDLAELPNQGAHVLSDLSPPAQLGHGDGCGATKPLDAGRQLLSGHTVYLQLPAAQCYRLL